MSSATNLKTARLAARVTEAQKRLVQRAADFEGVSTADFTVAAAVERAKTVLADRVLLELDGPQWQHFLSVLDQPATPMPGLVELLRQPGPFAR